MPPSLKQRLTSRKFLVTLIAQIVGIAVLVFPEEQERIVQASTNVAALLLMLGTGMGYIRGESEIDAARVNGQALSGQLSTIGGEPVENASTLPGRSALGAILLALCLGVAMPGCATLQGAGQAVGNVFQGDVTLDDYHTLRATFNSTLRVLQAAKDSGELSHDTYMAKVDPWVSQADLALYDMKAAIQVGNQALAKQQRDTVEAALDRLGPVRISVEKSDERTDRGSSPGGPTAGDQAGG